MISVIIMKSLNLPNQSILGVHYNGCHDTSVAIVSPTGDLLFACSLERLSRVKGDGRVPTQLIDLFSLDSFRCLAWPFYRDSPPSFSAKSASCHQVRHGIERGALPSFQEQFFRYATSVGLPQEWNGHEFSHAATAYYSSEFDDALVFVYDAGTWNCPWFGGIFQGSGLDLTPVDLFPVATHSSIASFFAIITGVLGFRPLRHEGKVMGLAAYAAPDPACVLLLRDLFEKEYEFLESSFLWLRAFEEEHPPRPLLDEYRMSILRERLAFFSRETVAASLQKVLEDHVLDLLDKCLADRKTTSVCLGGGIFANVKLNQRILNHPKVKRIHVFPAMGDEGTAVGAAFLSAVNAGISPKPVKHVYLGTDFSAAETDRFLGDKGVKIPPIANAAQSIATLLDQGKVVAIFDGAMEFGPRALGHRSVMVRATDKSVNDWLNTKFSRSEFMPFAPCITQEQADVVYGTIWRNAPLSSGFMTITFDVASDQAAKCPAVVHVDGTSRPQIVNREITPLLHAILEEYTKLSGIPSLINTSFNMHEEPIVCTLEDAWRGFWQAELDALYCNGYLIEAAAIRDASKDVPRYSKKIDDTSAILLFLWKKHSKLEDQLHEKEGAIQRQQKIVEELKVIAKEQLEVIEELKLVAEERLEVIEELKLVAEDHLEQIKDQKAYIWRLRRRHPYMRIKDFLQPRLGRLEQYPPCDLSLPTFSSVAQPTDFPKISIVTPSLNQGAFIERTIKSVLEQGYPKLEYVIQDGGSTDNSVHIIQQYAAKLHHWETVKDKGQANAINMAFSHTSGEIMAYLNADDMFVPGVFSQVVSYFDKHPDVDVVYGNRIIIDENDKEIGRWVLPPHDDHVLAWADYIPQETMFWRASIWERGGGAFDESFHFAMDWDLILRFKAVGAKFLRLPLFLGLFRVHPKQKTSAKMLETGREEMATLRRRCHGRDIGKKEIEQNVRPYLRNHLFWHFLFCLSHKGKGG